MPRETIMDVGGFFRSSLNIEWVVKRAAANGSVIEDKGGWYFNVDGTAHTADTDNYYSEGTANIISVWNKHSFVSSSYGVANTGAYRVLLYNYESPRWYTSNQSFRIGAAIVRMATSALGAPHLGEAVVQLATENYRVNSRCTELGKYTATWWSRPGVPITILDGVVVEQRFTN